AHPGTIAVTDGPLAGTSLMLSGAPVTFGRAPDNTIVIDDDFASSHHARISAQRGAWMLEDLGSTNGTIVDGSPMTGPVQLRTGTRITIGHTTLETRSCRPPAPPHPVRQPGPTRGRSVRAPRDRP